MNSGKLTLVVLAVVMCVSIGLADLQNGSFENGWQPASTVEYWANDVPSGFGNHGGSWGNVNLENWRSHSGTNEASVRNWGGTDPGGAWWQDVTNDFGAGSIWSASAYFCNDNGGWGGGVYTALTSFIKVEFHSSTAQIGAWTNNFALPGENWTAFSVSATAPVNTVWARLVIGAEGQGSSGALQFDDATLSGVIPEPMSAILIVLGLAGIFAYRRRS